MLTRRIFAQALAASATLGAMPVGATPSAASTLQRAFPFDTVVNAVATTPAGARRASISDV